MTIADRLSQAPPAPPRDEPLRPPHVEPNWDVAKLFPYRGEWTENDYFLLNTNSLVELSDGSLEVLPVPTQLHQAILILVCALLRAFVRPDPDASVLVSAFSVRLWPGKIRQPDVLYMSGGNVHRRHETHWDGADLVVEIVSDDDRRRDLEVKRREYAWAGIPECWIIDPLHRTVTVLRLDGDHYALAGEYAVGDTAASALLPGFTVARDRHLQRALRPRTHDDRCPPHHRQPVAARRMVVVGPRADVGRAAIVPRPRRVGPRTTTSRQIRTGSSSWPLAASRSCPGRRNSTRTSRT